jgi:hypothetical protein
MSKLLYVLIFLFCLVISNCDAQQNSSKKALQFHSINNIGLLEGQAGSAFQLQTINGAQYKSCFVGFGLGLDYYRYRTIPLFFDVRKEFGKSDNKFFAYADAGIHFSSVTDKQKTPYAIDDKFSNGFYCDAGIGYKIVLRRNNSLLINLGYSFKRSKEDYRSELLYYYGAEAIYGPKEQHNYNLNRVSIKIGWGF